MDSYNVSVRRTTTTTTTVAVAAATAEATEIIATTFLAYMRAYQTIAADEPTKIRKTSHTHIKELIPSQLTKTLETYSAICTFDQTNCK